MNFADRAESRANNFDFLRLLFASSVLWYHCFPLLFGVGDTARHTGFVEHAAGFAGGAAVAGFFMISGFLVTGSWLHHPNIGHYLRNRALRIYPAFLVCSLFCALVVGPLAADHAGSYWRQFHPAGFVAYMLLLVGPYIPPVFQHLPMVNAVDGSFWTLRYEFECYLLVAFLGLVGLYRNRIGIPALWGGLFLVLAAQTLGHRPLVPSRDLHLLGNPAQWLRLACYFFAGMTFYLYRGVIPYSKGLFLASMGLMGLACCRDEWFGLAVAACGPYALFFIAFQPRIRLQNFARHGDFSYGMYLYAFPIQQLFILHFGTSLTPARLFCLAFPTTLLLAVASWHFVERPCLRLKRSAEADREAAVAAQERPSPAQPPA